MSILSPELQELVDKEGVDLGGIGGGGAPAPTGPLVYVGGTEKRRAKDDSGRWVEVGGDQTKTLEEMNAAFYKLSPDEVEAFQQQLVAAGLLDPKKTQFGVHDDATYSAWSGLNERAAKFYAVGKKLSPEDVLGMIGGAAPKAGDAEATEIKPVEMSARQRTEMGFRTADNVYTPSDPAEVRSIIEAGFQSRLGRKPTKEEESRFVNGFLGSERANQDADFAFADSGRADDRGRDLAGADAADSINAENDRLQAAAAGGGGAGGGGGSEAEVLESRVAALIAASPYKITPGKKTRSYEEQVRLWNNYKSGKGPMAAKPGTSKHGDGRANDLQYSSDKARQWALANASKFGLHFPIYNPKLARSKDESWHVEVLGYSGAKGGGGHQHGGGGGAFAMPGRSVAPISRTRVDPNIDAGARAKEFAEDSNPTETAAYDIGTTFDNFLSIINGRVA